MEAEEIDLKIQYLEREELPIEVRPRKLTAAVKGVDMATVGAKRAFNETDMKDPRLLDDSMLKKLKLE